MDAFAGGTYISGTILDFSRNSVAVNVPDADFSEIGLLNDLKPPGVDSAQEVHYALDHYVPSADISQILVHHGSDSHLSAADRVSAGIPSPVGEKGKQGVHFRALETLAVNVHSSCHIASYATLAIDTDHIENVHSRRHLSITSKASSTRLSSVDIGVSSCSEPGIHDIGTVGRCDANESIPVEMDVFESNAGESNDFQSYEVSYITLHTTEKTGNQTENQRRDINNAPKYTAVAQLSSDAQTNNNNNNKNNKNNNNKNDDDQLQLLKYSEVGMGSKEDNRDVTRAISDRGCPEGHSTRLMNALGDCKTTLISLQRRICDVISTVAIETSSELSLDYLSSSSVSVQHEDLSCHYQLLAQDDAPMLDAPAPPVTCASDCSMISTFQPALYKDEETLMVDNEVMIINMVGSLSAAGTYSIRFWDNCRLWTDFPIFRTTDCIANAHNIQDRSDDEATRTDAGIQRVLMYFNNTCHSNSHDDIFPKDLYMNIGKHGGVQTNVISSWPINVNSDMLDTSSVGRTYPIITSQSPASIPISNDHDIHEVPKDNLRQSAFASVTSSETGLTKNNKGHGIYPSLLNFELKTFHRKVEQVNQARETPLSFITPPPGYDYFQI